MSTLPFDNTARLQVDNTIEDPRQRSPLVLNHHDFASVTEEICAVNEALKPPSSGT